MAQWAVPFCVFGVFRGGVAMSDISSVMTSLSAINIKKFEGFTPAYLDYIFRVAPFWMMVERDKGSADILTQMRRGEAATLNLTRIYKY
jgi:hypothetical protein